MDPYAGGLFVRAAKHDGMVTSNAGYEWAPTRVIDQYSSTGIDAPVDGLKFAPDTVIDALSVKFQTVKNSEAVAEIMTATDTRIIEQHYGVFVNNFAGFTYWQSYLQGYSMEQLGWSQQILWSRLWVTAKK